MEISFYLTNNVRTMPGRVHFELMVLFLILFSNFQMCCKKTNTKKITLINYCQFSKKNIENSVECVTVL